MHAVVCFDWLSCAKSDAHSEFCFVMMMMMMAYCRCLAALPDQRAIAIYATRIKRVLKRLLNALALYCWLECWLFCPKAPTRTFHSAHIPILRLPRASESKSSFVPSSPPLPTPYTLQDSPTTKPTLPPRARNQTTAFGLPAAVWFDLCTLVSKLSPIRTVASGGRFAVARQLFLAVIP